MASDLNPLCRSDYYSDTGKVQHPGERVVRCNRHQGHEGDHDEVIDGERGVVTWPSRTADQTPDTGDGTGRSWTDAELSAAGYPPGSLTYDADVTTDQTPDAEQQRLADISDAHHEGFGAGVAWADQTGVEPKMVLWMLDLDEDDRPWQAHMIVEDDGETRVAACGERVNAGTHPRGWWSFPTGQLPLSGPNSIHCGWTRADIDAFRSAKGWTP